MLFNHKRELVDQCRDYEDSKCPLCDDRLAAKRCKNKLNHWAHFPQKHDSEHAKCQHFESEWHLRMKLACMALGWEIEVPAIMDGKKYLIDAVDREKGRAIEFIHTINDQLWNKHVLLSQKRPGKVTWVFDGEMFAAARRRRLIRWGERDRYQRLLKPKSRKLYDLISGYVHFDDVLYARDNGFRRIWEPVRSVELTKILEEAEKIDFRDVEANPEVIRDRVTNKAVRDFAKLL